MSSIFLVGADNSLTELSRTDYDSEDLFQRLLADHPALLRLAAGPEGKLLLIRREQPVPDTENGSDRWSLDHLFLDRQGVPVLVEVKQASDTRARREVVAQMLDYAANGVAFWSIEKIIQSYRATAENAGQEPDGYLASFLDGGEVDPYWRAVESNMRAGRIRMLFVADRISKELSRIVEFLNEQMRPAEVLAIEVEQFTSLNGLRTLVPRLLGQTERAQSAKAVNEPKTQLSEAEWMSLLEEKHGFDARRGAERTLEWFRTSGFGVGITDSQDSLFGNVIQYNGRKAWPFFLRRSTGRFEISLGYLANTEGFGDPAVRQDLLERLREIPSSTFRATDKLNGWPSVAIAELLQEPTWTAVTTLATEVRNRLT